MLWSCCDNIRRPKETALSLNIYCTTKSFTFATRFCYTMRILITLYLYCVLLALSVPAFAQDAEWLNQPYHERLEAIYGLNQLISGNMTSAKQVADTLAGLRRMAHRAGDKELLLEADLLEADYAQRINPGSGMDKLLLILKRAEQQGMSHIACRTVWRIGQYYWGLAQYEQGFRWYLRLDHMMQTMDVEEFPDKANYLEEIGRAYYRFGDYDKALPYFRQVAALPVRKFYLNRWRHAINTMGLTYRELARWEESDACFNRLIGQAEGQSEQWVGIASGNLGQNYYLRGNYEKAIPLLEMDIRIAEQYEDWGLAAGSAIPMADILVQYGRLKEARSYIDMAYRYIQRVQQTDRLRRLYPVMSKWHTAMGQQQQAALYLDSALAAGKRFNEKFNALKLMRANQEVTANQQEAALQKLRAAASQQRLVRNTIIGGLLAALIGILFIYRATIYRNRTQRKLQQLELDRARQELDNAQKLLDGYTRKIHNNSRIIQSIEDNNPRGTDDLVLQQLRTSTILTESDWEDFREQFHKIYPDFTERLLERHPDLTSSEVRFLLLLRLGLTNPEIAHALGISPASLRVTWHRLRKKLGLSADHTAAMVYTDYFVDL